jgi:hypothetical protein
VTSAFRKAQAPRQRGGDGGADAVGVDAADGDLVGQGDELPFVPAVDEQGLAGFPQGRRQVPQQGGPGEPGADDHDARPHVNAHRPGHLP